MMYILQQRLLAQKITGKKSSQVLQDIISEMFATDFVADLFKPQGLYNKVKIKETFSRLVHSSIMRLNETSMDKLHDLMFMGVKRQIMCARDPIEIIHITLNHIDTVITMVPAGTKAHGLAMDARNRLLGDFTIDNRLVGVMYDIKRMLFRFFQDRLVKISIFLQTGMQTTKGTIIVRGDGPLALGIERPGKVIQIQDGKVSKYDVPVENMKGTSSCTSSEVNWNEVMTNLGRNLYIESRCKHGANVKMAHPIKRIPFDPEVRRRSAKAAKSGLADLAFMVGSANATPMKAPAGHIIHLDLGIDIFDASNSTKDNPKSSFALPESISINTRDSVATRQLELEAEMADLDMVGVEEENHSDDDLLGLLES